MPGLRAAGSGCWRAWGHVVDASPCNYRRSGCGVMAGWLVVGFGGPWHRPPVQFGVKRGMFSANLTLPLSVFVRLRILKAKVDSFLLRLFIYSVCQHAFEHAFVVSLFIFYCCQYDLCRSNNLYSRILVLRLRCVFAHLLFLLCCYTFFFLFCLFLTSLVICFVSCTPAPRHRVW